MATKENNMTAPTPCLTQGCYEPVVDHGRCETHKRPAFEKSTRKQRLPKDWNTRRQIVMARDKGICYLCGGEGADTVDHIKQSLQDDHSLGNLGSVHDRVYPHCHRYKTAAEGHEAQRLRRNQNNINEIVKNRRNRFK